LPAGRPTHHHCHRHPLYHCLTAVVIVIIKQTNKCQVLFKFKCDPLRALSMLRSIIKEDNNQDQEEATSSNKNKNANAAGCASAHFQISEILGSLGRFSDALEHLEKVRSSAYCCSEALFFFSEQGVFG
jgi:hypothetical protein